MSGGIKSGHPSDIACRLAPCAKLRFALIVALVIYCWECFRIFLGLERYHSRASGGSNPRCTSVPLHQLDGLDLTLGGLRLRASIYVFRLKVTNRTVSPISIVSY